MCFPTGLEAQAKTLEMEKIQKEVYILLNKFPKNELFLHYFIKILNFHFLGGYIFFETSLLAAPVLRVDDITIREGQNAFIESPIMKTTGPEGKCVSFRYTFTKLWIRLG